MKNREIIKFWKELIYTDGKLDEEKVMNELSDYSFLLDEVPKVYMAVTDGKLSKPNYHANTIIQELEENYYHKETTDSDLKDLLMACDTLETLQEALKDYFNLSITDNT